MKHASLFLFSLLLASCSSAPVDSFDADESISESELLPPSDAPTADESADISNSEGDSTLTSGTYSLIAEDIPETSQSEYNIEFDFQADSIDYHASYLQRGNGTYAGTIQMKKECSYLYNLTPLTGTLTFAIMNLGEYTGTPSISTSLDGVNWTELTFDVSQNTERLIYTAEVEKYFYLSNTSEYKICFYYLEINCHLLG